MTSVEKVRFNDRKLVIVGASGLDREVYSIAKATGIEVRGFLDSRAELLDALDGYPPILGTPEGYEPDGNEVFVCAVGDAKARGKYAGIIASKGGEFVSLVHPTAVIGCNAKLGDGCIVRQFAVVGCDAVIGDQVQLGPQSTIAHDCVLGDLFTVSPGCNIAGWCRLGSGVFLGVHSALVPRVALGPGVFVAAGAVVTGSFEAGRLMGIPARPKESASLDGALVGEWKASSK